MRQARNQPFQCIANKNVGSVGDSAIVSLALQPCCTRCLSTCSSILTGLTRGPGRLLQRFASLLQSGSLRSHRGIQFSCGTLASSACFGSTI